MAVSWGAAKGTGTKFRVGIECTVPTPTTSDVTVTITTKVWVWTKDKVTDSSVSLSIGGTAVTAGTSTVSVSTPSNSDWSSTNKKLVLTTTKVVATSHVAQTLSVAASMTGMEAAGASTTASHSISPVLKASPALPPAAPVVAGAVTRVSDTIHTITWTNTNPTSTTAPYKGIYVERWDNVKAGWYRIASVGVVTSFTDKTTAIDRRYQYRVQAYNGGGVSAYSTTSTKETTPAVPAAPLARRPAVNVEVSWSFGSTIATGYELWHAANGVMDGAKLATLPSTTTSYTHFTASTTQAHTYFLKAVGASYVSALSAASSSVSAAAPPLTPSNLAPSGGILDAAEDVVLTFTHNPVDNTDQVGFKVRWREQGVGAWIAPNGQTLSASANATTNAITCTGHMLNLGDIVRLSGAVPAPLVAGTHYFAIPVDATSFQLALTEDDAEDDIPVDLTSVGGTFSVLNGRVVSNTSYYVIPGGTLDAGKAYEWSIATDGRYNSVNPSSPWAPVGGFRTATKPTLTIDSPVDGGTIGSPSTLAAWIFYTPDEGVVQQWAQVSLYDDEDNLLETYEASGQWSAYPFVTTLVNGGDYRVDVVAEGSNGIRSDVYSSYLTAEYLGPSAPGLNLTWDSEDGLVVVDISNPVDLDRPPVVKNALYRSVGDGKFVLAASGLPADTTVIDYVPAPNKVNNYRVVATADDGTTTTYDAAVSCTNTGDWYWLNGGDSFDLIAKVRYEGGTSVTFSREKALHNFAGRTRPVEFTGPGISYVIDLTALLPRDAEGYATHDALLALVEAGGEIYYRDPVGRRLKCSLGDVELSDQGQLIEFRTTLTEVDE